MANDPIGISESTSPTKRLDAEKLTTGANTTVHRERMQLAGRNSSLDIMAVLAADPGATDWGAVVRPLNSSSTPLHVVPTTTIGISGNATVSPAAGSSWQVQGNVSAVVSPAAGTSWHIEGNATAAVANSSGLISTGNPLAVHLQSSTATVTVQGNATVSPAAGTSWQVQGNVSALVVNSSGAIASGNPLHVLLQGSTATVTIQGNATVAGNVTAILSTASIVRAELASGNLGGASNRPLWVQVTTGVLVANSSGTISTGNPLSVQLQNSTATVTIQGNATVGGNVSALVQNSSGTISSGNPLHVYLQNSTATVTVQGNVSAAISGNATVSPAAGTTFNVGGNVSAAVAGNVTALITTGSIIRAELASGNLGGASDRALWVQPTTTLQVGGNVTAILSTAFPAYSPLGGTTASGGLVVFGKDGTATNSTARPLIVNSSGELLVVGGTLSVGGIAQINTTGGSTMLIVGGMDGLTSNSTARPLQIDASGKLLVDAAVTIGGLVDPGATAGTTAFLIAGAEGQTSDSIARVLLTDASGKLQVNAVGNTSVVGNVTAILSTASIVRAEIASGNLGGASDRPLWIQPTTTVPISGNVTALISTAFPAYSPLGGTTASGGLVVFGKDGTATDSTARPLIVDASGRLQVQVPGNTSVVGNVTALITTGSKIQVEPIAGTSWHIDGNATVHGNVTAIITTGSKIVVEPAAGTSFHIEGNTTAIVTTGSKIQVEPGAGTSFNVVGGPVVIGELLNTVYDGTTAFAVTRVRISVTATGHTTLIASATGAIYVLAYNFVLGTSGTVGFFASGTATDKELTGPMVFPNAVGGGLVAGYNPKGWFKTASGESLLIGLQGATGPLGGVLTYARPAS